MADEVKRELRRDLSRTVIAMPGKVFENRPIWVSIEPSARVWADFIQKQYQIDSKWREVVLGATRRMAKAIDFDLHQARVAENGPKVIIETPLVRNFRKNSDGRPNFELVAGLESKKGLFEESYRVGYIQQAPEILNSRGLPAESERKIISQT